MRGAKSSLSTNPSLLWLSLGLDDLLVCRYWCTWRRDHNELMVEPSSLWLVLPRYTFLFELPSLMRERGASTMIASCAPTRRAH